MRPPPSVDDVYLPLNALAAYSGLCEYFRAWNGEGGGDAPSIGEGAERDRLIGEEVHNCDASRSHLPQWHININRVSSIHR
jgi:hypothetical protein